MTIGLDLLSAIRKHGSRAALQELTPDLFVNDEERQVFEFMQRYVNDHKTFPKPLAVRRHTRIVLPTTDEPYTVYLENTRDRATYNAIREPYAALVEIMQGSGRPNIREAKAAIEALNAQVARYANVGSGVEDSSAVMERVMAEWGEAQSNHDLRGVTSGWDPVDDATLGYQSEDLITWVGRPGRGKSWLLIKQAYAAWRQGHRVLFVSMEMSAEAIMRRMIGIHSRVNPHLIRSGTVSTLAQPALMRHMEEMRDVNPIDFCTANFNRSVSQVDGFIEQYLPDIIYVDASYLLTPNKKRYGSSGRRETISDTTEEMKQLASNAHRPIVQTVQFNRTAEIARRATQAAPQQEDGEEQQRNAYPLAHLGLEKIGETDVIGQASSHVFGIELPQRPYQNSMRVFGFLKGREGEDGHWYCNYPETRSSPVDLSLVANDDPRLQALRAPPAGRELRRPRQRTTNLPYGA